MRFHHPTNPVLPRLVLLTDARNEDGLWAAMAQLPMGAAVVMRDYHLGPGARRARFQAIRSQCQRYGLLPLVSGSADLAKRWGAAGHYAAPDRLGRPRPGLLRLATVHSLAELAAAHRNRADMVLISPVFATRSHAGAATLGPVRFRLLVARAIVPVLALGGMTAHNWRRVSGGAGAGTKASNGAPYGWAAIDGLTRSRMKR